MSDCETVRHNTIPNRLKLTLRKQFMWSLHLKEKVAVRKNMKDKMKVCLVLRNPSLTRNRSWLRFAVKTETFSLMLSLH